MKNLVVGAGLSGSVIANLLASRLNENVLVIDTKNHVAGNCYDYRDNNGIMVHKYGSHIFHTNNEKVWSFVRKFADFNQYMHRVFAIIDGNETTIPFNFNTLYAVFPPVFAKRLEKKLLEQFEYNQKIPILELQKYDDTDLKFLANYIYEKVFLGYTLKQWGLSPEELDPSVTGSVPVYISKDCRYFQEKYQGIPRNGYTKMFERLLENPLIEIKLKTRYEDIKDTISYERLFYTGAIEEFFNYKHGKLPYRSLDIKIEKFACEKFQNAPVVNYPENYDFTRIAEYKYFLSEHSNVSIVSFEYPEGFEEGKNERIYPILNQETQKIYNLYQQEAQALQNTYFLGRLGAYRYYDMNRTILGAFETFAKIKG